ncbi:MAG: amino-acid N-acetyltransferase, partial [Verrucomicrobia bacterium]|nr:amino-acid N-acetyltransferase [Verrucomicrobiota bacterium]
MKPADLRGILKYVPQYRNKTFVIALDGVITESENFSNILLDVAVLCSLNIRVVLVHGISSQVKKITDTMEGFTPSDLDGTGITDDQTLKVALIAANRCTHEILEGLTTADLRAVTCNGITAHPMGIIRGVDHQFTGKVERVDVEMFQTLLKDGIIPVAPPLGFDGEGNTYRVNSDNIAATLGIQLQAQKVIFVTSEDGLYCNGHVIGNIQSEDLHSKLNDPVNSWKPEQISKAQYAIQA